MNLIKKYSLGIVITVVLALVANFISGFVPLNLISGSVFALLIGMLLHPFVAQVKEAKAGIQFVSKKVLQLAIILMGVTLSFSQVVEVGKYSLIVMIFTLFTAFGGGYVLGKLFGMNWKLSALISAGAGICGGSAIAAIAPTIDAEDKDIAYAISTTFLLGILMVILFPLAGRYFHMSDIGFGLWVGTAVNDTSSVVAAGYAFSDAAGAFSMIVKLTRTLAIIPTVLIFSLIHQRMSVQVLTKEEQCKARTTPKIKIKHLFPYFIVFFLAMVTIKSIGIIPDEVGNRIAVLSKFLTVMALGAIGLKINIKEVLSSGVKPLLHACIVSFLIVIVSFGVQVFMGQL